MSELVRVVRHELGIGDAVLARARASIRLRRLRGRWWSHAENAGGCCCPCSGPESSEAGTACRPPGADGSSCAVSSRLRDVTNEHRVAVGRTRGRPRRSPTPRESRRRSRRRRLARTLRERFQLLVQRGAHRGLATSRRSRYRRRRARRRSATASMGKPTDEDLRVLRLGAKAFATTCRPSRRRATTTLAASGGVSSGAKKPDVLRRELALGEQEKTLVDAGPWRTTD